MTADKGASATHTRAEVFKVCVQSPMDLIRKRGDSLCEEKMRSD